MMKTVAKIFAILAILGLVLSSFALTMAQTDVSHATPLASFNRDLTVGSSGADVTALQNWLISKGFTIAAGATGYFGGQTQAALARYQASVGISPAAGYFGPITRAKVNATVAPAPVPDVDEEDDEDDDDDTELSVEVEIRNGGSYVEAEVDGDETSFTLSTTRRSTIIERVAERLDVTEEQVEDVIEFIEEDDDDARVTTTAEVDERDGADNDVAEFTVAFDLTAFGDEVYISRNPATSIVYEIQDADGDEVSGATSVTALLRSSADEDSGYYHIDEGEEERFTLTVVFDPLAADEGEFYRLVLTQVRFNDTTAAPDRTWNASPARDFETDDVYISD